MTEETDPKTAPETPSAAIAKPNSVTETPSATNAEPNSVTETPSATNAEPNSVTETPSATNAEPLGQVADAIIAGGTAETAYSPFSDEADIHILPRDEVTPEMELLIKEELLAAAEAMWRARGCEMPVLVFGPPGLPKHMIPPQSDGFDRGLTPALRQLAFTHCGTDVNDPEFSLFALLSARTAAANDPELHAALDALSTAQRTFSHDYADVRAALLKLIAARTGTPDENSARAFLRALIESNTAPSDEPDFGTSE